MRAGLSTIQQTLTQEAASVLNHSIADAARRNHGQTTPVHVAATLLASPTGYLRQACIRSHPNSSHPLQCRALELCFTVALERLPTSAAPSPNGSGSAGLYEPPISNALLAALKRAQAHQRRGCPENQQQPLLAVKVELEQLIISILDDPSVSRVMREASFSSPAVKAAIEQSLSNSQAHLAAPPPIGPGAALRLRPSPSPAPPQVNRNVYLNPRLQSAGNTSDQSATRRREDVRKVVDILLRNKKRNPVIVGDSEPEAVERELLQMIEKKEIVEALLRNVQVVSLEKEFGSDKSQIQEKMKDLENLIDARLSSVGGSRGVILDLGDLKWLVEQPSSRFGMPGSSPVQQQLVSETSKAVVAEMGKLLAKFRTEEAAGARVWVIGTATCETYLRCQVYHPSMENDWDLPAMPITARAPIPSMFHRLGGNKLLGNSTEALNALKNFPMAGAAPLSLRRLSENADPGRGPKFCPSCAENYEREAAKLSAAKEELEKAAESDAKPEQPRSTLPQWMQMAKLSTERELKSPEPLHLDKDQDRNLKQKTENLQKKWRDTCRLLHPSFHTTSTPDRLAASHPLIRPQPQPLLQPKLAPRNPLVPGLHQVNQSPLLSRSSPERRGSPPTSPVRTELGLGRPKPATTTIHESATLQEKTHNERVKDLANCISSEWQRLENLGTLQQSLIKQASALDADSFKSFFKGLAERVAWQTDAASVVATAVIQSKSGNPRRRGGQAKGDTWLLFLGPDREGKRRMASALSELLCRPLPVTVRLGSRTWRRHNHPHDDDDDGQESDFRGKTGMDRVADAVRRNPLSVIVLEDFDQADLLVYGSLRRAMERGRLVDSHGREVSLGSAIFILSADWLPENTRKSFNPVAPRDEKVAAMAAAVSNWQLQLSVDRRVSKRRADWASDDERALRPRKEVEGGGGASLSFDLNMSLTEAEEEAAAQEASRNSSELTTEREPETRLATSCASPLPSDLAEAVDETVAFRPVDFGPLRTKVVSTIMAKFGEVVGEGRAVEVADDALDRIVGGVWFGRTGLEEWADRVLVPGFRQLRDLRPADVDEPAKLVRLTAVPQEARSGGHDWLPARVAVNVDSL